MAHTHNPGEDLNHIFILHLWREHVDAPWRASLRASGNDERTGFADLEQLAIFLLYLTEGRPFADQTHET